MTFENPILLGDGSKYCHDGFSLIAGRVSRNITIRGGEIQGFERGVQVPAMTNFYIGAGGDVPCQPFTIDAAIIKNNNNVLGDIVIGPIMHDGTGAGSNPAKLPPRKILLRNLKLSSGSKAIVTRLPPTMTSNLHINFIQKDEILVENYNGTGENFQVFFKEQAAAAILPQTSVDILGSPEAGLTNAQNLAKHKVCRGNAIAPNTDAAAHPEIIGYIAAIEAAPDPEEEMLRQQIAELKAQVAALTTQVADIKAAAAAAASASAAQITALNTQLAAALADRDVLSARVTALEGAVAQRDQKIAAASQAIAAAAKALA